MGQIYRAQGLGEAYADVCPSPPVGAINRTPTYFLIVSVLALEGEAWYTLIQ